MKCPRCRENMESKEGEVEISFRETSLKTITDIWVCTKCDMRAVDFQTKIEPRKPLIINDSPFEKLGEEKNG